MNNKVLTELSEKRKLWVQSTRDNNFDNGIFKLLTELYPDNAHFIYELLQNAEDSEATTVSFILKEDRLEFSHDGRLFNEKDINGITSIGEGTKADDINKIGKFGVGFKAVFTYTKTPQIFSGEYNFEVIDLVVPNEIKSIGQYDKTLMIFPFNSDIKSRELAFQEIKHGLEKLKDNTLLFLNSISKIEYSINNNKFALYRNEINDVKVEITNTRNKKTTKWLRLKKYLPKSSKLFTSIAFKLTTDEKSKKDIIKPIEGQVSIFFPAEKENSNLKFHIHAPFASTVARDSIKDLPENKDLLDQITRLLSESLIYFKEEKILDFNLLRALPIEDDNLSPFYLPILNNVIQAFNNQELVKTDSGKFKPGYLCYRASVRTKKVIDIETLKIFEGIDDNDNIYWIKNPPQLNQREDKFLQALSIKIFSDDYFISNINNTLCPYSWDSKLSKEKLILFLETKDNQWIKNFYELLYDILSKDGDFDDDYSALIKLDNGQFNSDYDSVFFKSEFDVASESFNYVEPDVYSYDKKVKIEKAKEFLIELGVKAVDIKDEIQSLLENQKNAESITHDENLKLIERFIKYFNETKDAEIFNSYFILINDQNKLVPASEVLVASPYYETGLEIVNGIKDKYLLNDVYKQLSNLEEFINFIKAIGANFTLSISKSNIYQHRDSKKLIEHGNTSQYTITDDWLIEGQENLIKQNHELSLLFWKTMCAQKNTEHNGVLKIFNAVYRRVSTSPMKTAPSSLIYALREVKWIPDSSGKFHLPQDISKDKLHDDFIYNNENGWLTEIYFGENIKNQNKEYRDRKNIITEETGLTYEQAQYFKKNPEFIEDYQKFVEQKKYSESESNQKPSLVKAISNHTKDLEDIIAEITPSIIKNEEEYRIKAQEKLDENFKKSHKKIQSRITTKKVRVGKDETKEFLKKQYKGHCQVCGFTFGQKKGKGNYFEFFDWLSTNISKQDINIIEAGSSLCLCSRCHSGIKYGDFACDVINDIEELGELSELTFDDFTDMISAKSDVSEIPEAFEFIDMDMYKISIRLLNKNRNIFYSEEHFMQFFNLMTL